MTATMAQVLSGIAALAIVWLGIRVVVSGLSGRLPRRRFSDTIGFGGLGPLITFIGLVVAGALALQCGVLSAPWAPWFVVILLLVAAFRLAPGFALFGLLLTLLLRGGS